MTSTHAGVAISAALLAAISASCGATVRPHAATAQPAVAAPEPAVAVSDEPGLLAPAVSRLPREVDTLMRLHLGSVRGTAYEEVVLDQLPRSPAGPDRVLQDDILAHTEVVTIGLGEDTVGWVFEGALGQRFDAVVERFVANGAPTVTGSPGRRSVGDERTAIGEVDDRALTVYMPAAAAARTGEIPTAVSAPALQRLAGAIPAVPAGRVLLFEAWASPSWGLLRELQLVARVSRDAEASEIHVDAALRYPNAEIAASRASGWGDFWDGFVEESPESFDRDSAVIRREGAMLVLHHELRPLFDEPGAAQRIISWTLLSLAAHQPPMNVH